MQRYQMAVFAACAAVVMAGTALAQPNAPLPTNNPEAQANVKQSEEYSALLRSNPAFRKKREQIECGPIQDAQMRQDCINTFEAYASSPPPARRAK
jgi:hypothetical protein